jgi:hypothetical protein
MRRALVGGAVALALAACSGETEILVHVGRDTKAPATIPRLRVYAAVATGQMMGQAQVFVDQSDPQADVDTSARDLATDPYALALKPGGGLPGDAKLQLAAIGYRPPANGVPAKALAFVALDHTVSFANGKVLEYDLDLTALPAGGVEVDARGCADFTVGGQAIHIGAQNDWDCDGDPHGTDCNDLNPHINSMATEICGNNVDEDCDGKIDEDNDEDGDGFTTCAGDCIDNPAAVLPGGLTAAQVHPGATEVLDNAVDENCDGTCAASSKIDFDQDMYTTTGILTHPSSGGLCMQSDALIDCDDMDATVHPGATENPTNGKDDDCNGVCDVDEDGDGYTPSGFLEPPVNGVCAPIPGGLVDCKDTDPNIHPGAPEICDGIDENCDGKCDDDVDGDGYSVCGTVTPDPTMCVVATTGTCMPGQQCDCAPTSAAAHPVPPAGQPVPELCDGFDENCDGVLYPQQDGCFAANGTNICYAGTRACDDTNSTAPWGDCKVDTNQPVDPRLCAAYTTCFADASQPDPFACAMATAGLAVISCHEGVATTGSVACLPATDVIPTLVSAASCATATWTLLGGTMQGPWTCGFGDTTSDTAVGCTATFEVSKYDHTLGTTSASQMLITQTFGAQSVSVLLDLSPLAAPLCTTADNLVCTGP